MIMKTKKFKHEFELEINDLSGYRINKNLIKRACKETINIFSEKLSRKKIIISIGLVKEEEMRRLNREYRKKDKVTDVLSFCEFETREKIIGKEEIYLGELILCPSYIEKNAAESDSAWQKDFFVAMSHGTMHLLGIKHGKKMFAIQEKIGEKVSQSLK